MLYFPVHQRAPRDGSGPAEGPHGFACGTSDFESHAAECRDAEWPRARVHSGSISLRILSLYFHAVSGRSLSHRTNLGRCLSKLWNLANVFSNPNERWNYAEYFLPVDPEAQCEKDRHTNTNLLVAVEQTTHGRSILCVSIRRRPSRHCRSAPDSSYITDTSFLLLL